MRPDKDEAAIVSFTGEVTLEQGFTGNLDRLRRAIDRVEFVPPSGYIGGGVVVGRHASDFGYQPDSGRRNRDLGCCLGQLPTNCSRISAENTRRTIILLTDGDDTISQVKMHDAIERAQKADALIYAIGIGDTYQGGVDEGSFKKITEKTGGRAYFPRKREGIESALCADSTRPARTVSGRLLTVKQDARRLLPANSD